MTRNEEAEDRGSRAGEGARHGRQEAYPTVRSDFDPAAGNDIYEPEKIVEQADICQISTRYLPDSLGR